MLSRDILHEESNEENICIFGKWVLARYLYEKHQFLFIKFSPALQKPGIK